MADVFLGALAGGGAAILMALAFLTKATLILGAAWGLERLSQRASAAVRHGIWAVALLGVVSLPIGTQWLPALTVDVPGLGVATGLNSAPDLLVIAPDVLPAPAQAPPAASPGVVGARIFPSVPAASPSQEASGESPRIHWLAVLPLIWAIGTVLRLLWFLIQVARVRWLSGYSCPETDGPLTRRAEELARHIGIRRPVCVLESSGVSMPLTWGVFRPFILLPEEASEWSEGRLRVVLLHELAHIRRWDYLTFVVAEIACALYWPLPLVWLARRRVQAEQEQACDDLVLASGTPSLEYAEHLLAVARAFYGNRWELGATVSMAREISLKHRIRTILDDRTNRRPFLSGSGLLALLLLSGFALPVAALRPDVAPEDRPDGLVGVGDGGAPASPRSAVASLEVESTETAANYLWLEAEDGIVDGPMEVRENLEASAGGYVVVPDAAGNDAPEGGPGRVSFSFELPQSGEYVIWGRLTGEHDNDNSLYVSMDGGPETLWDVRDAEGSLLRDWGWLPLGERKAAREQIEPVRFELSAGVHTLRVRNREDGTRLDRMLITSDTSYTPSGRGGVTLVRQATHLWMEVEQARLEGAIERGADQLASGGRFIFFEHGRGAEASGTATFAFDVETAGRYVVWGRVLAPDRRANSFYVSLDGGAEVIWDAPDDPLGGRAGWWSWSPLNARDLHGRRVDPLLLDLSPGRHALQLRTREPGVRLDGILVTDDLGFRPQGIWPEAVPTRPVQVWLEAESARLRAPLLVRGDSGAAGGLYVEVEDHGSHLKAPDTGTAGSAVLRFTVSRAGLYTVWARTLAHNGNENSFWVRVNGGRWIRWNGFAKEGSWRWSTIQDDERGGEVVQLRLDAGDHLLEVAPREGGARLDRLLVTNDPLARPDTRIDG